MRLRYIFQATFFQRERNVAERRHLNSGTALHDEGHILPIAHCNRDLGAVRINSMFGNSKDLRD